jgi:hypothetical protein
MRSLNRKAGFGHQIAELQSRRSATEPLNTGKAGCGLPALVGNELAGGAGGSPGFQALGGRLELREFGEQCCWRMGLSPTGSAWFALDQRRP